MTQALAEAICLLSRAPGRWSRAPVVLLPTREDHVHVVWVRAARARLIARSCQRFFAGDSSAPSSDPHVRDRRSAQTSVLESFAWKDLDPKLLKCKTGDEFARYAKRNGATVHRKKHVQIHGDNGIKWTVAGSSSMSSDLSQKSRKVGMGMFVKMGFGLKK